MQGLFMKLEVLELMLMANKGFHVSKIAWGDTATFGEQDPVGVLPNGLGDDPSSPKVPECG